LKSLYGLTIAPKKWWMELDSYLTTPDGGGWTPVPLEHGMYYKDVEHHGQRHRITLTCYVDDMVITAPTRDLCMEEFRRIDSKFKSKLIAPGKDPNLPDTDLYDILG